VAYTINSDRITELLREYTEQKQYVESEKPYWINLTGGTTFSGPLRYQLENYFPETHYKKAVDHIDEAYELGEESTTDTLKDR